jgi:hypothetical protein
MKSIIERCFLGIITVGGAFGVIWGAWSFVDWRISHALSDQATLRRIAQNVRPSCIFNEKGSVLFDSGAMAYIDDIRMETNPSAGKLPARITIRANRLLPYAPEIRIVEGYTASISAERGPKFDWIFTIADYTLTGESVAPKYSQGQSCVFRLDILL